MGNSACSSTSGIPDAELIRLREEDEACLRALEQQLPASDLCNFPDLSEYRVPGCVSAPKASVKPERLEVGLLCLQGDKLARKFTEVRTALQDEVRFLGETELSGEQRFRNSRLQVLCRAYDALLRQEERRDLQSTQQAENKAAGPPQSELPPLATATLGFGLEVLLGVVKTFGPEKPEIIDITMDAALAAVGQIPPMMLSKVDAGLKRSVEAFTRFFNTSQRSIPLAIQNKAVPVVVGLDIAKGDYGAVLADSWRLLNAQVDEDLGAVVPKLSQALTALRDYPGDPPARTAWKFSASKVAPDVALSDDCQSVTRLESDRKWWSTQQVGEVLTEGVHYIEFKVTEFKPIKGENQSMFFGVDVPSINLENAIGGWNWHASGATYAQGNFTGNFKSYRTGDRVGMLINMEERTLVYYLNKVKMQIEPLKNLPSEVQVGVSLFCPEHCVSIDNDAIAPEDSGAGRCYKKANAAQVISTTPWDIAHDKEFDALLTEGASATPQQAGLFLLAALAKQGAGAYAQCRIDSINRKVFKKYTLERSHGFDVAVAPEIVHALIDYLATLKSKIEARDYALLSFRQTAWACLSLLRLLLNHLFTALRLNIREADSGMTADRTDQVRGIIKYFSLLEDIGVEQTPENSALIDALRLQALLLAIHSLELIFVTVGSQLEFVLNSLGAADSDEATKEAAMCLLLQFNKPAPLFHLLASSSSEDRQRFKTFLSILTRIATDEAEKVLNSQAAPENPTVKTLFVAQGVLFAQVAQSNCSSSFLDIASAHAQQVVAGVERLAGALPETISENLETLIRRTMLDSVLITLLRSLTVIALTHDFAAQMLELISKLSDALRTLKGGKVEITTTKVIVPQMYESEHPYENSERTTHSVKIPGALSYTLTSDPKCYTNNWRDVLLTLWDSPKKNRKVKQWPGESIDKEPVVVKQEELYFTSESMRGLPYWGWKLCIHATVEVAIARETWADEVKDAADALCIGLAQRLVAADCQTAEKRGDRVLENPLLSGGVTDTGVCLFTRTKPEAKQSLLALIAFARKRGQLPAEPLDSYFARLSSADSVGYHYYHIPILEELVAGSERTISAFEGLKAQAKVAKLLSNLGGAELDQAERALFAVFLAFFHAESIFASLVERPQQVSEVVKFVVKQVAQVRLWARLRRHSEDSDNGIPYSEIGREIVNKCVLLLNTDFQQTLKEIGATAQASLLNWAAQGEEESTPNLEEPACMRTLQELQALRQVVTEEDKKQVLNVFNLVMDFLKAAVSAAEIAQEVSSRRDVAIARCIGLELLSATFKSQQLGTQRQVASVFSEGFSAHGVKRHYSAGTEGIDPFLQVCLRSSFFQLYRQLLNCLRKSAVKELDCTSPGATDFIMSVFEALSFPFKERGAPALFELNLRAPAQVLLSWAKGQQIPEKTVMTFDRSQAVFELRVVDESEYRESSSAEWMSLNPKNRIAGEVAGEIEGQQKLALALTRGTKYNTEYDPISAIRVDEMGLSLPEWERSYANCNELSTNPREIYIQSSPPEDGYLFLTKVTVSGWDPIDLRGEYKPFWHFWKTTPAEEERRGSRKAALRKAAWLLFKHLLFAASRQSHDTRLQKTFADVLAAEVKFMSERNVNSELLQLQKLLKGKSWQLHSVSSPSIQVHAVAGWVGKIYEDSQEYRVESDESRGERPGDDESSLLDVVNQFVGKSDPLLKGHIPATEEVKDLPAEYRNADGEVDFFCFLQTIIAQAETWLGPFWQKYVKWSKLLQTLPSSLAEAELSLGSGSVAGVLNSLTRRIIPNKAYSFLSYLNLFSAADQPGIVPKEQAPEHTPPGFFNEDGQLDFFTAYRHVIANPQQFSQYFKELKAFADFYELPSSCSEYYKSSLSPVQAEYQASLLLMLCECSTSPGFLSALVPSKMALELLNFMFFGSVKTSVVAFRTMRGLIAHYSPESFSEVWTAFHKTQLRVQMGEQAVTSLVHLLLAFVGMRSTVHLKSWHLLSMEKVESAWFEAFSFLQALFLLENWRAAVLATCADLMAAGEANTITVGALSFLRSLDGHSGFLLQEWANVELKGGKVLQGTLIQHKAGKLKLYCEDSDSLLMENLHSFVNTQVTSTASLRTLPEQWVSILAEKSADLVAKYLQNPIIKSAEVEDCMRLEGLRRLVVSSAVDILCKLWESPHQLTLTSQSPQHLADILLAAVEAKTQPLAPAAVYYQLRGVLYSKLKGKLSAAIKSSAALSEEEGKGIADLSEEKQMLAEILKSMGVCFADIQMAIEKGCTEVEGAIKYIEQRNAASVASRADSVLYRLANTEFVPSPLDTSGTAVFTETPKGHLVIRCEEVSTRKEYTKCFGENVLSGVDTMPEEVTVLAALSATSASSGLRIGDFETSTKGPCERYAIRLFMKYSGSVTVHDYDTGELISTGMSGFDFEDFANVRFGVVLESPGRVELAGLMVLNGHYDGKTDFIDADAEEAPATDCVVPYCLKRRDATVSMLQSALGLSKESSRGIADQCSGSMGACVLQALKVESEHSGLEAGPISFVSALQVFSTAQEVPSGINIVRVFDGGKVLESDPDYKGKTIGVAMTTSLDGEFLTDLKTDFDRIYPQTKRWDKSAAITGVVLVKVRDTGAVDIPAGYEIVGEAGNGFNLSPESPTPYFLAFTRQVSFRQQPFTTLAQISAGKDADVLGSYFDTAECSLDSDLAEYKSLSAIQLHNVLVSMEKSYRKAACARLLMKIATTWPETIDSVEKAVTLLEGADIHFADLKPPLEKLLDSGNSAVIAEALLVDVITQLVKPCFPNDSAGMVRKTVFYQSMPLRDSENYAIWKINVPGAKKIQVIFDSRYMRGYNDFIFTCDQMEKHVKGACADIELPSSSAYCEFRAAVSLDESSYRLKTVAYVAGEDNHCGVLRALWLLEEVVFTSKAAQQRFLDAKLLPVLWLFTHSTESEVLRGLTLLRKMCAQTQHRMSLDMLSYLSQEVESLFTLEALRQPKSALLKESLALVFELKGKFDLTLGNQEINELYESFCCINGFRTKDLNFRFFLLREFLTMDGRPLSTVQESEHPCQPLFSTHEIARKGASRFAIEFSDNSECDPHHTVLFTQDPQGTQCASASEVPVEVQWTTDPSNSNLAISNAGKTITPITYDWAKAVSNRIFDSGKVTAIFKPEGNTLMNNLFLGAVDLEPPDMSFRTGYNLGHSSWMYASNGRLMKKNSNVNAPRYYGGDLVSLTLDFDKGKVTFARNGEPVGELDDLVGPVALSACIDPNLKVTLVSVVMSSELSQLSHRKEVIPYDKFYYHFPVNVGYVAHLQRRWAVDKNPHHSFSDRLHFKHNGDDSSLVATTLPLKGGVHLLHISYNKLHRDATFAVGIVKGGSSELLVSYHSDGVVKGPIGNFEVQKLDQRGDIELLFATSSSELRLFNASKAVGVVSNIPLEASKEYYFAVVVSREVEFEILVNRGIASEIDLMGRNAVAKAGFGYKFTATPEYWGPRKLAVFESIADKQPEWSEYLEQQTHLLSHEVCEQLVSYVDEKCSASTQDIASLIPEDTSPEGLLHYSPLEKLSSAQVGLIFRLIVELNREVHKLLPFTSLDLKDSASNVVQQAFLGVRELLFCEWKRKVFAGFLINSQCYYKRPIPIDRQRAIRHKARGFCDSQGIASVFGQFYQLMKPSLNRNLRHGDQICKLYFVGEDSTDIGALYDEAMSIIGQELMSRHLPLFVPCPNGVNNLGDNRDHWVPNPRATSPQQLDLFLFLGKLFGVAIRTQNNLNLSLPPVFWKRLILDTTTTADLKGFDECIFQTLQILRHLDENGITPGNFSLAFDGETFTTRDSSGRLVELCEGGKDRIVTFENATEYADLLEKQRLTEAAEAYAAIRKGISAIVPLRYFYTFSWKQAETLVCGSADVSVDLLRGKTSYSGYSADHAVTLMFWNSLADMTATERSLFLRFVWGRARLPFSQNFKNFTLAERKVSGDPDKYLPLAHARSFRLELPPYTNKETMREKLVHAITHRQATDLDLAAAAKQ